MNDPEHVVAMPTLPEGGPGTQTMIDTPRPGYVVVINEYSYAMAVSEHLIGDPAFDMEQHVLQPMRERRAKDLAGE